MTDAKQISLTVPKQYTVDPLLLTASPEEVALVLDLASRIPKLVTEQQNEMQARVWAAREEGSREAIRKMRQELLVIKEEESRGEVLKLTCKLEQTNEMVKETEQKLQEATRVNNDLQTKHAVAISEIKHQLAAVTKRNQEQNEAHQSLINIARQEESQLHLSQIQHLKEQMADQSITAMEENCKLKTQLANTETEHIRKVNELTERINELSTPMSKGNTGEACIADILTDLGFHVQDTSTGDMNAKGYLDLLVLPESGCTDNMRVAIEIKNKKIIRKASDAKLAKDEKDISDDIKTFQARVREGIKNDLFDAAVFLSIRAHTKMGQPVVLEMHNDSTQRPLFPVTYIGPEKGKLANNLSQEQIETHLYMIFALLEQTHAIKSELCNDLKQEEIAKFQALFDHMGTYFNQAFLEFKQQEKLIAQLTQSLTNIRCKSIQMIRSVTELNSQIPWLQRKGVQPDWYNTFEVARQKSKTLTERETWNNLGKSKSSIENSIGVDAMRLAIKAELQSETHLTQAETLPISSSPTQKPKKESAASKKRGAASPVD